MEQNEQSAFTKLIGTNIKQLREKAHLTTTQLAKKVNLSQAQISRLENAKQGFRTETMVKIATALGVPVLRLCLTDEQAGIVGVLSKAK